MKMRSSYIFCLLAMCYIAYAAPDCPDGGMKMDLFGIPCRYICEDFTWGTSLHSYKNGTHCKGPGVADGICKGGECKNKHSN
uniref:Putative salivary secreted protein n=1 Tax=Ixodes ricinus TaxID=34613 RepID=A0A6B0U8H5_IXORI